MKEENNNNQNKEKKENCPLCQVSDETIEKLKEQNKSSGKLNKKREKYLFKKEKKEKERLLKERKKRIKKFLKISLILAFAALIIGGAAFGAVNYLKNKSISGRGTAKIEINSKEYNFGVISMADGLVKHTYEIKNIGERDLEIKNIKTSCMCTTARLKVGEKESPKFGMHDNPAFWSEKIPSGKIGYLEVVFNPAFHGPQGTGSIVREIYFSTNDPQNKNAKVRFLAEVVR